MDEGARSGPGVPAEGMPGPPAGVREIEHTADVGIEVEAGDLPSLFHRAAAGVMHVLGDRPGAGFGNGDPREGRNQPGTADVRSRTVRLSLSAAGTDLLLARWLREILFLHEAHSLEYRSATFPVLESGRLEADVVLLPTRGRPEREIKGVTYHGLTAERRGGGWWARVIFDL